MTEIVVFSPGDAFKISQYFSTCFRCALPHLRIFRHLTHFIYTFYIPYFYWVSLLVTFWLVRNIQNSAAEIMAADSHSQGVEALREKALSLGWLLLELREARRTIVGG